MGHLIIRRQRYIPESRVITFMQQIVTDFNGDSLDDFFEVQNTTLGIGISNSSLSANLYGNGSYYSQSTDQNVCIA